MISSVRPGRTVRISRHRPAGKAARGHPAAGKAVMAGQKSRLAGQGAPGAGRGEAGDLYMTVEFEPDPRFRAEGRDITGELPVAPWEAALGATVTFATPSGEVSLTVPPGTSSG